MAANDLTVVRADTAVKTLRSQEIASGVHAQVVQSLQGPESMPVLTGATLGLISISSASAVTLVPPTAGAVSVLIRAWETTQLTTKRMFYRNDGTAPTNAGANCEGYLLHGEAKLFVPATGVFTNFKVIAESGGAFQISCEWRNS